MAGEIREENLSLALKFIVDNYGEEALLNPNRVEGILSDLLPKSPNDVKWAVEAIQLGVVKILLDENNSDKDAKKQAIKKAEDIFKVQYVAEVKTDYILDNLSYALGWSRNKVESFGLYEESKKKKDSQMIKIKKSPRYSNSDNGNKNDSNLDKPENVIFVDKSQPKNGKRNNPNQQDRNGPGQNQNKQQQNQQNQNRQQQQNQQKYQQQNQQNQNRQQQNQQKYQQQNQQNQNRQQQNQQKYQQQNQQQQNQQRQQYQQPPNNNRNKIVVAILVALFIIGGVFIGTKFMSDAGEVVLSDFKFNSEYELQGTTYMFDENKTVEMNVELSSKNNNKIDYEKLSYSIENGEVCNYKKESDRKCILVGLKEGQTTLKIMYDGKEIKSIDIGFGKISASNEDVSMESIKVASNNAKVSGSDYTLPVGEKVEIQVELSGDDADYSKLSYSINDSNMASISGTNGKCSIYGNKTGVATLSILYDGKELKTLSIDFEEAEPSHAEESGGDSASNADVDLVIKGYLSNYSDAVYYGDTSYVSGYLTPSGDFYKMLENVIPGYPGKNVTVDVIGYTKGEMKKENGHYRVPMTIEYNVYNSKGAKYQKEYSEYIVVQKSGEWLIDRYENWRIVEERNL